MRNCILFLLLIMLTSCSGVKNVERPFMENGEAGYFREVRDGLKIFVYEHLPSGSFSNTIYIISGITGINHNAEMEIIEKLGNNENRVVVIHPRGTGYSEGKRGDGKSLKEFIGDYVEIIRSDDYYNDSTKKFILYGHSMSCAIAIMVGNELGRRDAVILVNPPCKLKPAKGMSPGFNEYLRYIAYYIFAPHKPVVNMAGDPSLIEDEQDRKEAESRNSDPLLVKYFSMHYMKESKRAMDAMVGNGKKADYPLLLLYGENDNLVDKAGCDELFTAWGCKDKSYEIIKGGSHGRSTVLNGIDLILSFLQTKSLFL